MHQSAHVYGDPGRPPAGRWASLALAISVLILALLLALANALGFALLPDATSCVGDSICLNARSDERTRLLLGLVVAALGAAAAAVSLVPAFDRSVHLAALASACVCVPAATMLFFVPSDVGR